MNNSFQDYAIQRLARSGVAIDPSFVQFCHNKNTRSVALPEVQSTVLCIGSFDCFWLILANDVSTWIEKHNTNRIPIHQLGKSFLELPDDLPGSNFTPVSDQQFTEYEALVWLDENKNTYKRILEIVNNINY